jgi:hypothetical protein
MCCYRYLRAGGAHGYWQSSQDAVALFFASDTERQGNDLQDVVDDVVVVVVVVALWVSWVTFLERPLDSYGSNWNHYCCSGWQEKAFSVADCFHFVVLDVDVDVDVDALEIMTNRTKGCW